MAISDCSAADAPPVEEWLAALAAAGVPAVQLREKALSDRRLAELARLARRLLPPSTLLLINRRADIALAAGADGVHLPAAGLPTAALRHRFGRRLLIGRSTHRLEEVERERDEGADYVTFGPVFPTPSKAPYGAPPGLPALAEACRVGVPVLALGGITDTERLARAAAAGAAGAAAIRLLQRLPGLPATVARAHEQFAPAGVAAAGGS